MSGTDHIGNFSEASASGDRGTPEHILADKVLISSTLLAAVALLTAQWRATLIGWHVRDLIQLILFGILAATCLFRNRLTVTRKAVTVISLFFIAGIIGFSTLGMKAGGIFFFPLSIILTSLFFTKKSTLLFAAATILCIALIAFRPNSAHQELITIGVTNIPSGYWITYLCSFILFIGVSVIAILRQQESTRKLIGEIKEQDESLRKTNRRQRKELNTTYRLSGTLHICSFCKNIEDEYGDWDSIEHYVKNHSEAQFSHGICPKCLKKHYPEFSGNLPEQ